ncbi:MAG: hypothetical protein A2W00_04455 [Candidatus Eisenbacteria bacterium RBG_16_71_46]|nr:MAG: hypothetical protein A2V59_06820 [Armatimonadetes bacterium RBG_19FT_COMBO_69_19]OGF05203.1 MAG: hypothetical protein A2W00_04455 [Candidatus Eisenbacteria bacterium RBG_16_71_46]
MPQNYSQLVFDGVPVNGVNEVQRVTLDGSPTGGTFTLTYAGQETGNIAYNATAAVVQAALQALSNVEPGDVACSGGSLPATPVDVTFQNNLGGLNQTQMTGDGTSLTGVGDDEDVTITTVTPGVRGTYRGAQNGCVLAAKNGDGAGVLYENTGTRATPTWTELEEVV